ncbi:helix-turn-helix transcriptional regulator [Sandaracinus amylolyticus]|uniref:Transcriptional regulator, AraC family protein n=1 Tax=Sandaracinus amylolyticus TaxID=927083 RepID=A0A0F6VZ06_9BACT|nr:AraC family transcriptional regulator [Sandaracinus amylolyticus]AKF03058.1 Transcriptional regulator, AraC family protein [Sandaracinus amylolyticus]
MRPRLILDLGSVLILGPGFEADTHAHHAVQLVLSFDGEVVVEIAGREHVARAALVPSEVPHRFSASGRRIALLLVDREAQHGAQLDRVARQWLGRDVASELVIDEPRSDATPSELVDWTRALIAPLLDRAPVADALSDVVRASLDYVARELVGRPRLEGAARAAGVSPSHLTHTFSAEMGIPFRRFVLWARAKRAVDEVRRGASLTEAAIAAGFSDSAHLSRTFRRMFGLPPSFLLQAAEISDVAASFKRAPR